MLVAYKNKTPDVTLKRQIYPNCNLNATKIKESTESQPQENFDFFSPQVAKVAWNKRFFKYGFCVAYQTCF